MQPVQLAARGLELALYIGCALAIGYSSSHSLCRLLDLQLPLDLLPEQSASILQTLLKLWVQNIPLIKTLQVTALKDIAHTHSFSLIPLVFFFSSNLVDIMLNTPVISPYYFKQNMLISLIL